MIKLKLIILLFIIINFSNTIYAQKGSLQGKIIDTVTKEPLVGVNIIIKGTKSGTITNEQGEYIFSLFDAGIYTLNFRMMGYELKVMTDVLIRSNRTTNLNIKMKQQVVELSEEITVTASSYFEKENNAPISVRTLTHEEIRRTPGVRGDINRMVQTMPGVTPATESNRNDLFVRGGSPSEVLYTLDNIEIPNPNHFPTQGGSGGVLSLINNEVVEEIKFISGGFPAQYGDKVSAVIGMKYIEGSYDKFGGKLALNFGGLGGHFEGTINNGKGSWLCAMHHSYLELLEGILDIGGVPIYTNFQTKIVYNFSKDLKLSIIGIGGIDKINIEEKPEADDYKPGIQYISEFEVTNFKSNQFTVGINLKRIWNSNLFSHFTISHSVLNFNIDYDVNKSGQIGQGIKDMSRINTRRFSPYHRLDIRFDQRSYFKYFTLVSYFSLENIYFRENQYRNKWNSQTKTEDFSFLSEFLPIGGFSFEF